MVDSVSKKSSVLSALVAMLVLGAFATLLGLGTWQLNRLEWKEELLARINQNLDSEPVTIKVIVENLKNGEDIEYRPVTVSGQFDHSKERHFFATHKGRSGYYIYTPLIFDEGVVFINRGFVEFDLKSAELRPQGQVKGTVTITGLARSMLSEKPSRLVPDNEPEANRFFWKDLIVMAQSAGLDFADPALIKLFIDADATANVGGYPIGGVTIIDLPNNHLQYAVTWYGLALALVCVVGFFLMRRKSR